MHKLTETIQSIWQCDWCKKLVERTDRNMPENWEKGDEISGHYCNRGCGWEAKEAWEAAFDAGLTAQTEAWEKLRVEWCGQFPGLCPSNNV